MIVSTKSGHADTYLDHIEMEIGLIPEAVRQRRVVQLHFGGGTPNFLAVEQIERLGRLLRENFQFADDAECSVELDPRRLNREQIAAFRALGMNRASFGVQDSNLEVQKAVHRIQPLDTSRQVMEWLRAEDFRSVNIDLIYGLPGQSVESFHQTIDDVLTLEPDRLAVFSYAHVPWVRPAQKLLEKAGLPDADTKIALYQTVTEKLIQTGFTLIGLDHFARPEDELAVAQREGILHRNFQGYTTHGEASILGLGLSSISESQTTYHQNAKDLEGYYSALRAGRLPIDKGYRLGGEDQLRRSVIRQLMCNLRVDFREIESAHLVRGSFSEHFAEALAELQPMVTDGLIEITEDHLEVTPRGRHFLRNLAMPFDAYLPQATTEGRFSRTV